MQSVLMGSDTVGDYAKVGVQDPGAVSLQLPTLIPEEDAARDLLVVSANLRIEWERIPWPHALEQLKLAGFPMT